VIEFARTHIIGRAAGHSAVKAASYRSGTKQHDERNGLTADYSFRADEVVHSDILLPDGAPEHLLDRNTLWNEIEFAEDKSTRRSTAQLAKDHIIALPRELALDQQIDLARDFAQTLTEQGVGVDLNVHLHSQDNPHAHLMTTTRIIDQNGIGGKARHLNGGFSKGVKLVEAEQLRHTWAKFQNAWCADRGIDLFVTNNDGQWRPEMHRGPKTHIDVLDNPIPNRAELDKDRADAISENPGALIDRVSKSRAVFNTHDLYRELHKHVSDPDNFDNAKARLDDFLIKAGKSPVAKNDKQFFTVRKTIDSELELKKMATTLLKPAAAHDKVDERSRQRIIEQDFNFLSGEQKDAVKHITGAERLSVVIGFAGSGKSTMLKAAAAAWKSKGQRVIGAALAGIAADGLEQGADIKSSTIHSLLIRLDRGSETLRRNDVVVIDEAGMLDTGLMHKVIKKVHDSGAKVVLVGDSEQLQPIQAGGPLRALSRQGGYCEISTIRRQNREADRLATSQLAKGNASQAFDGYQQRGQVTATKTTADAIRSLVIDTVADIEAGKNIAVLAHTNQAVSAINQSVRDALVDRGRLKNDTRFAARGASGKLEKIDIGVGDRIVFRKNDAFLGVKNGSLGTVIKAVSGAMKVKLDDGDVITVDDTEYDELAHGYAMTIHKSQGVTVDNTKVLLTAGWDRHLAYVAMSRHKEDLGIFYGMDEFQKRDVASVINQSRVQESAIDFAERHGIDVKEADGSILLIDQTPDDLPSQAQQQDREATTLLKAGNITEAFRHYESRDRVTSTDTNKEAMDKLVVESVADIEAGEQVTIIAHTNQSVNQLNKRVRDLRKAAGAIKHEISFRSDVQKDLKVGTGDHILFNKDDKRIGIKKGMVGAVTATTRRGKLSVKLTSGKTVEFDRNTYHSISHGYAMTISKSKSVDIDRARVLITNGFDRNLSFDAMSQHKKELTLYFGKDQFKGGSPVKTMARERTGVKRKGSTKPTQPPRSRK